MTPTATEQAPVTARVRESARAEETPPAVEEAYSTIAKAGIGQWVPAMNDTKKDPDEADLVGDIIIMRAITEAEMLLELELARKVSRKDTAEIKEDNKTFMVSAAELDEVKSPALTPKISV